MTVEGAGVEGVSGCVSVLLAPRDSTLSSWRTALPSTCLSARLFGRRRGVRPVEERILSHFPAIGSGAFSGPRSCSDAIKM